MKCNQTGCGAAAVGRYTWPGRTEAGICAEHLPKLRGVADACGFAIQVIPLPVAVEGTTNPHDDTVDVDVEDLEPERITTPTKDPA